MLPINKLLLPLLITSTSVIPASYAHQNPHQTMMPDEQLKNRLHQALWSHKEVFGLKDTFGQFDLNSTFLAIEPFFTDASDSAFLIYENKTVFKNKTYRIYACISESRIIFYGNIAELDWYPTVAIVDANSNALIGRYVQK